jgi:GNAT superfamily N-acetyltransferase
MAFRRSSRKFTNSVSVPVDVSLKRKVPQRREVEITVAAGQQIAVVQGLWREYWSSIGLPPDLQGFVEEVTALPGVYGLPGGRLLLAMIEGEPAGTAAFRPLDARRCEAKRLYVRTPYRGQGIGQVLLDRLVEEARTEGYSGIYCDTLKSMTAALQMYKKSGFSEVAPYSVTPTPEAIYLGRVL